MPIVNTTSTLLISVGTGGASASSYSDYPAISDNGRYVVFSSNASNLVPNDANGHSDIFWRDTLTGETLLVTQSTAGVRTDKDTYLSPASVTDDGRYVVFQSDATNLVAGDDNNQSDVFLRDIQTGVTTRISEGGNGDSRAIKITDDGHYAVFSSFSSNLVPGDANGKNDIFRRDLTTGETINVSLSSTGAQSTGTSQVGDISENGRYVSFANFDGGLTANDTNAAYDVFLRDIQTGVTTLVSGGLNGQQANSSSFDSRVSDDGRYVAFSTRATNIVADDTSTRRDVFVRDMHTGVTTRVSVGSNGQEADRECDLDDMSADGRYILFTTNSTNLVAGDTNDTNDLFVRDMVAGTTTRLTYALDGTQTNGAEFHGQISDDGRYVTFLSRASNVNPDGGTLENIFRVSLFATESSDMLIGSDKGDAIDGLGGADTIVGGLGADTMSGGAGNDTYYVDAAGDKVVEVLNQGTDTVHATMASYTLTDNVERLYFDDTGAHTAKGNALSNLIYGNAGLDKFLIDAGGGDTFSGGGGEDTFDGRAATTGMVLRLDAQANNAGSVAGDTFASIEKFFGSDTAADQMTTGAARAKFFGYGGNDTLIGGSSIDALSGGAGNDSLVGNGGQDALDGGIGNDTMTGGSDADTFTFVDAAFGQDVITDFEDGIDRLKVFSAVAHSFSDFTVTGNGTHHVVLTLAAATANTITLDNASTNITVTAADFLFY